MTYKRLTGFRRLIVIMFGLSLGALGVILFSIKAQSHSRDVSIPVHDEILERSWSSTFGRFKTSLETASDLNAWSRSKAFDEMHKALAAFNSLPADDSRMKAMCRWVAQLTVADYSALSHIISDVSLDLPREHCLSGVELKKLAATWRTNAVALKTAKKPNDRQFYVGSREPKWGPSREVWLDTTNGPELIHGHLQDGEVALTFDDGPHPTLTAELLNTLEAENVQVGFFMVGRRIQAFPDLVRKAQRLGHSLGNHSWSHPNYLEISKASGENETRSTFMALEELLGEFFGQSFFRFPYGAKTRAMRQWLRDHHVAHFFWNIDTRDWQIHNVSKLLDKTLADIRRERRGIVLFHDIQPHTVYMMKELISVLKLEGFRPVVFREPLRP